MKIQGTRCRGATRPAPTFVVGFSTWALLGAVLTAAALPLACGSDLGPTPVDMVEILPHEVLLLSLGAKDTLEARLTDPVGDTVGGVSVTWNSGNASVVSVEPETGVVTALGPGHATITAAAAGVSGVASVEVYLPDARSFQVGVPFLGRESYVEYIPGDLPLVLSAPHGGDLEPEEIPERTFGVSVHDRRTQETARVLIQAIQAASGGGTPHVVINRLHRNRFDANREVVEAAQGSVYAERAWSEYHEFLDSAKARAQATFGAGLFLDLHGHGHPEQRLELGYLLSADELNAVDSLLDGLAEESSIKSLAGASGLPFSALIRGDHSLGALLADAGVRAVPGRDEPGPGTEPYFTGGYNTSRHGSLNGGVVDGIQLELNWTGVRETASARAAFAQILAGVLQIYLLEHYGIDWPDSP